MCGGINVFRDALKANFPVIEVCDGFDKAFEGTSEPIQSPHNERIPFSDIG